MVWRCVCGLDIIVRLFLLLFPHCELSHFTPQYINSGYLLWAQLLLQFCTDRFETLHMFSSWYEDVHVVWVWLLENFSYFFYIVNLVFFHSQYIGNGYLLWAQLLLQFCTNCYETLHMFFFHGMKMCMWFGYNWWIIFCYFLHIVNLVIFHPLYINSWYLLWAQLLLQFCTNYDETLHVFSSWY